MDTRQQLQQSFHRTIEALNARDWDALDGEVDATVAADYIGHYGARDPIRGPEGLKQFFRQVVQAIPSHHATLEEIFIAGNQVATRFTARRTDPATGNRQRRTFMRISHFEGARCVEEWQVAGSWEDET